MRRSTRRWLWLALALVAGGVGFGVVRTWLVPALIVREIRQTYHGRVVVRDWWFGPESAGIGGVELGESDAPDSPTWFAADRIEANVTIRDVLKGRILPTRIEIDRPRASVRLDAKGLPITKIPFVPKPAPSGGTGGKAPPIPEVVAHDGIIKVDQQGRKPMTIAGIEADLKLVEGGEAIRVTSEDQLWGRMEVSGKFDPTFKRGVVNLRTGPGFVVTPEKIASLAFVPAEVWDNVVPSGPVDARVRITLKDGDPRPIRVHTELDLKGMTARLNSLQVTSTDTSGQVIIDDGLVLVRDLKGKAVDGTIAASGDLDFTQNPPRIDLDVRLKEIDVTKAPKAWQLAETGATGKLTAKVDLRVALPPGDVDLTGTSGEGVIEDGSFQGIPIKSLNLDLAATGGDLRFATETSGQHDKASLETDPVAPPLGRPLPNGGKVATHKPAKRPPDPFAPLEILLPLARLATHDEGVLGWAAWIASEVVSYQDERYKRKGSLLLPKTVSTRIELEDVDLKTLVAKAEKFGIKIPVPVAGRFSIRATATIPLADLGDIRAYAFHGDASLSAASIDHVDLGQLMTRIDVGDGVIELKDFRGHLVNRPEGDASHPPVETPLPPVQGELPVGGFRASLRAEIAPRGAATVRFEGRDLPLGEIFAPFLPVPTPLSGDLTMRAEARAGLANLADTKTWTLDGRFENRLIRYQGAVLDHASYGAQLKNGRLEISNFDAKLAGRPMRASIGVGLAAPHAYTGEVDVTGWEIARVLGFVPGVPRPAPASGSVSARADASGTLIPFAIKTQGQARVEQAKAGPAPLGNVAFRWETDKQGVAISGIEASSFGGKISGDILIPTVAGKPARASVALKGVDTARIAAGFLKGPVALAGLVDGRAKVVMPLDLSSIVADALLTAPDLLVRREGTEGVRVASLRVEVHGRDKLLDYKASAESLGGPIRFRGSIPINATLLRSIADGEFQAAGFRLADAWRGLGIRGALADLEGLGAVDANIRAGIDPLKLFTSGNFEFRELHYGSHLPIGGFRGSAFLTPTTWRIENLQGELFGGVASGKAQGTLAAGPARRIGYEFKLDRVSLPRLMVAVPSLAKSVEGIGSLHVAGRFDEAIRAAVEVRVPRATAMKLPISDLRFPADVQVDPATGVGSLHSRHWSGHLAGGTIQGDTWLRLGNDRTFHTDIELTGVDLGIINRLESDTKRPASGKLKAKITLGGPNPSDPAKMRGRIDADLDDASLVELPVLREIDRFLGPARGGGLFEDGDLHGTIANKTLFVEELTLQGKLVQVHATGTITFAGDLNLAVLANTNQIVSQSGSGLLSLIPGLNRTEQVLSRLAVFLENRLLKLRVTGTIKNPSVGLDAGIGVGDGAAGFFSGVFGVGNR